MATTRRDELAMRVADSEELKQIGASIGERIANLRVHNGLRSSSEGDFRVHSRDKILNLRKVFVYSNSLVRGYESIADIISLARRSAYPVDVSGLLAAGWRIWGPDADPSDPDLLYGNHEVKDSERWNLHLRETFDILFYKLKKSLTCRLHNMNGKLLMQNLRVDVTNTESMIILPSPDLRTVWADALLYLDRFSIDAADDGVKKLADLLVRSVNANLSVIEAMDRTYGTFVIAVEQTSAEGLRVLTLDELKHQWLRVFDQEALTDALISNSMLSIDTLIDKFNQTYEYESGGDRE